ncbi:hypothetical protein QFC22_004971 [Naganishia vaughanmartiniae]|uniref:Uncharacterized protein n=1 Tax=Naganishia vaughanmartiniae TaxID=1424756 RepID=A0ACC2WXF2_9TREE|nr:hypothetical protein QFC22_004971 [Naganishia vaughanmartiniae]
MRDYGDRYDHGTEEHRASLTVNRLERRVRNVLPLGFLPYMPRFLLPPSGSSSGYSSSIPLSSRLPFVETLRQECPDGYMPDFWRQGGEEDENEQGTRAGGTYKDFLNHLKEERKVGCVVLCCSDHEDDMEFKRNVLTNEEFVKCLRENDILIWGADIREREGYQVSQTLQATTYPAISFFSLMPVNASSGSSSNSKFTILTTVQGPPSTTTSAPALIQLITNTIVPRTRPFLNRLRRERHALEEARRVRDEQDRILAESERRDRDKILKIRRENEERSRREREEAERQEREHEIKQREKEQRDRFHADMLQWRLYAKQHLLRAEPSVEDVKAKKAIRVQIRLPQGVGSAARNVRVFPLDLDTSRDVYIWAETLLLGAQDDAGKARMPPGFTADYPPRRDEPFLKLFTAYPRKEVSVDAEGWKVVQDAGGSLVMELARGQKFGGDEDDEESEDESD